MENKKNGNGKERLDSLLVSRGLVENRTRAQALIMAGKVKMNGERAEKAGAPVRPDCVLEVDEGRRWASRGAFKLLKAIEVFGLQAEGRVCADIGASTGGFTDVLLSAGARKIYAIDVGYGQLLSRLANDSRVTVLDRTNARALSPGQFGEPIELAVCDASFISLRLLLPAIDSILNEGGKAVVLIKPQFEAGRERLGRGGVVRDPQIHKAVLREVLGFAAQETRLRPEGLSWSPLLGPEGNMEFLALLGTEGGADLDVEATVDAAHREMLK